MKVMKPASNNSASACQGTGNLNPNANNVAKVYQVYYKQHKSKPTAQHLIQFGKLINIPIKYMKVRKFLKNDESYLNSLITANELQNVSIPEKKNKSDDIKKNTANINQQCDDIKNDDFKFKCSKFNKKSQKKTINITDTSHTSHTTSKIHYDNDVSRVYQIYYKLHKSKPTSQVLVKYGKSINIPVKYMNVKRFLSNNQNYLNSLIAANQLSNVNMPQMTITKSITIKVESARSYNESNEYEYYLVRGLTQNSTIVDICNHLSIRLQEPTTKINLYRKNDLNTPTLLNRQFTITQCNLKDGDSIIFGIFNVTTDADLILAPICDCHTKMIKSSPCISYGNGVSSKCESCLIEISTDDPCWHCPNINDFYDDRIHRNLQGFDYCLECISLGFSRQNPRNKDVILSDRDISIILGYWYRLCNINNVASTQTNLPLDVIESKIIPYLGKRVLRNYQVSIGVIQLNETDFIKQYCNNSNINNINIEFIEVIVEKLKNNQINIKTPHRISSIQDISIMIILFKNKDNLDVIKNILTKLIKHSDEICIYILQYPSFEAIHYNEMKLEIESNINCNASRINFIDNNVTTYTKQQIEEMINDAVNKYIKNIQMQYKAI